MENKIKISYLSLKKKSELNYKENMKESSRIKKIKKRVIKNSNKNKRS